MEEEEARRIWRNLRREFGKKIKRSSKGGRAMSQTAKPQWQFYERLMFLKDQFNHKDSSGNSVSLDQSGTSSVPSIQSNGTVNTPTTSQICVSQPESSNLRQWEDERVHLEQRRATPQAIVENARIQLEREKLQIRRQLLNFVSANDEDVGYFNSLLPYVRRLHPHQKMLFRNHVQQQLFRLLYGYNGASLILPKTNDSQP